MYARFSEVVDSFTHMNMDESTARAACREGPFRRIPDEDIDMHIKRADLDDVEHRIRQLDGLNRWREGLKIIEREHGKAEVDRFVELDKTGEPY